MATALTPIDLKALRSADTITFWTHDGDSHIACTKRPERTDPWQTERRHELAVESYGARQACQSFISAPYVHHWQTLAACLKVGDVLTLAWHKDYATNTYVKLAAWQGGRTEIEGYPDHCERFTGLHADELYLEVARTGKDGTTRRLHFFVAVSICPHNSARMIQA